MKKQVVIKTRFEALHCWPECPIPEVKFLKNPHRHIFHVTLKWDVSHGDREIEFIAMKAFVGEYLVQLPRDLGRKSCEDIAEMLLAEFDAQFCSVFEDGENGAEVSV